MHTPPRIAGAASVPPLPQRAGGGGPDRSPPLRPLAPPQHGAEVNTVGVKEAPDGLDFFYANRSHALKLLDFLQSVVAIRSRADKQLVRMQCAPLAAGAERFTQTHTLSCVSPPR